MIKFDLPPTPQNTHLVSSEFNKFLDSTMNFHFSAKLAAHAIASTLLCNGARVEDMGAIADVLVSEHEGNETIGSMGQWPALSESFKGSFEAIVYARREAQGVTV